MAETLPALSLHDSKELDKIIAGLEKEGIDTKEEVKQQQEGIRPRVPTVKIEHSKTGKHHFYLDQGTGDEAIIEFPNGSLDTVVIMAQHIRAWWPEDSEAKLPTCAAISDVPYVADPVHTSCRGCHKNGYPGDCKPKIRCLILLRHPETNEIGVAILNLPATSIKPWEDYVLNMGKWPLMAVNTQFSLEDKQNKDQGYRWAVIKAKATALADKDMRAQVKAIREQYASVFEAVHAEDYTDTGDRGNGVQEVVNNEDMPF